MTRAWIAWSVAVLTVLAAIGWCLRERRRRAAAAAPPPPPPRRGTKPKGRTRRRPTGRADGTPPRPVSPASRGAGGFSIGNILGWKSVQNMLRMKREMSDLDDLIGRLTPPTPTADTPLPP